MMLTEEQVAEWVERYVHAWRTGLAKDIRALFTPGAEYHEAPYTTDWIGRDEIVTGWQSRADWQRGGWEFSWSTLMITGDTAAIGGSGVYQELGTFENLWVLTLDGTGRCAMFRMWNNEVKSD
jgi:hypothetical protein